MGGGINVNSIDEYLKYTDTIVERTVEEKKESVITENQGNIEKIFAIESFENIEKPRLTKDMLTKLVDFVYADKLYGEIHSKELEFLFELAEELNLLEEDMTEMLKNGQNKKYQNIVLNHGSEGVLYFIYEIHLSRQDGVITEVERARIYQQAKNIGIWTPKVKIIIDEWLDTLQRDDKKREEIETLHTQIMDSINYAKFIQNAMFPSKEEMDKLLPEYFIWNQPKDVVSGDFYWITEQGNKTMIAVADATGHGVPGSLLSFLGIAGLEEIVNKTSIVMELHQLVEKISSIRDENIELKNELEEEINTVLKTLKIIKHYNHIDSDDMDPAAILDDLRMYVKKRLKQGTDLSNSNDNGMDMSLISLKKGGDGNFESLEFAGAFNNLYIVRGDDIITVSADRFPIGIYHGEAADGNFTNHNLSLEKDDMIYMFSDGYQDQIGGEKDKKFMIKKLKKTLIEISKISVEEQKEILKVNMRTRIDGGNEEQLDDILFMGIRV